MNTIEQTEMTYKKHRDTEDFYVRQRNENTKNRRKEEISHYPFVPLSLCVQRKNSVAL